MNKLVSFFSLICVLNFLAMLGLGGYLVGTGRMDKSKAGAIVDMLRHKGAPDRLREQLFDILEPVATTLPATRPGVVAEAGPDGTSHGPATAEERIDFARQAMEQERLRLETEAQDLRHRQELLESTQAMVEAKLKEITDRQKAFNEAVAKANTQTGDEAFQKTMALYDELKPRQIKDLFISMPPDVVARYMEAMAPDRAAKIVGEFKTPPELSFINGILDRLRASGTKSASALTAASNLK